MPLIERRPLNSGDVLHIVQLLLMVLFLGAYYQKLEDGLAELRSLGTRVERMEHYESSKDPHYWDYIDRK